MDIKTFVDACHKAAAAYQLIRCSSGNMSWRVGDDTALMTASRSWMCEIHADQIAVVKLSDGSVGNGVTPTVEHVFHMGILNARTDMNVVLHFQTPSATVLACTDIAEQNFFVTPEIPYYIGKPVTVPFFQPGSQELADAVIAGMKHGNMVILRNHGFVTVGKDFNDAIQRAVFFEMACDIILRGGDKIEPLPQKDAEILQEAGKSGVGNA
jgi:ribulose-5-phosphate 4-epimerase/fuculose-1-phosphate aldolase